MSDTSSYVLLELERGNEIQFVVPLLETDATLKVTRQQPTGAWVEVNGAPLRPTALYQLMPGSTVHVVCWSARASVGVEGSDALLQGVVRLPESRTASAFAEYHCLINELRGTNAPPVVLICGRNDAPKSELALTLTNYAARFGWIPLLLDLDPSVRQLVSIPGGIGAAIVQAPIPVDERVSEHHLTTHYFVGSLEVQLPSLESGGGRVSQLWLHYMHLLADLRRKMMSQRVNDSGTIAVAPALRGVEGVDAVLAVMESLGVTHVVCVGDEALFNSLFHRLLQVECRDDATRVALTTTTQERRVFLLPGSKRVFLDKISCAAQQMRSETARTSQRRLAGLLAAFFHGTLPNRINPFVFDRLPLSTVTILRLTTREGKAVATAVERGALEGVIQSVAAVVDAASARRESGGFVSCSACGFAKIENIDGQDVSILTNLPKSALPPGRLTLLVGDIQMLT